MRVALLTNVLTPYRLPVYRELAATPGFSLRILLSAQSEFHWEHAHADAFRRGKEQLSVEHLDGLSLRRQVRMHRSGTAQRVTTHLPLGAPLALRRFAPDVIVSSELGARTALSAAYARIFGVPLVVWSYASRSAAEAASPAQQALRRLLLSRADAVVGMGIQAREALLSLGVPAEHLFDAPNAHDQQTTHRALATFDPLATRAALRARLGAREHIALVAGRLVPAKGIEEILEAWARVPHSSKESWTLAFVGDGPEAFRVREAATHRPGEIVHVAAVAPEEMPGIYAAADLLVFPSIGDPWGLVVNEAFACGLPVLCSELAGCADDLIEPEGNGWLFDPTNASTAAGALAEALTSKELERMGLRALETAKRFPPERMADGLRRAIVHASEQHGGRPR